MILMAFHLLRFAPQFHEVRVFFLLLCMFPIHQNLMILCPRRCDDLSTMKKVGCWCTMNKHCCCYDNHNNCFLKFVVRYQMWFRITPTHVRFYFLKCYCCCVGRIVSPQTQLLERRLIFLSLFFCFLFRAKGAKEQRRKERIVPTFLCFAQSSQRSKDAKREYIHLKPLNQRSDLNFFLFRAKLAKVQRRKGPPSPTLPPKGEGSLT